MRRATALVLVLCSAVARADTPEHLFAEDYKRFLDRGKTVLGLVREAEDLATGRGFRKIDPLADERGEERFRPGDRLLLVNRGRALLAVIIGKRGPAEGVRLVGTHIDTPHLRLLQRPFGRSGEAVTFRAVAQGGIKDYQW